MNEKFISIFEECGFVKEESLSYKLNDKFSLIVEIKEMPNSYLFVFFIEGVYNFNKLKNETVKFFVGKTTKNKKIYYSIMKTIDFAKDLYCYEDKIEQKEIVVNISRRKINLE